MRFAATLLCVTLSACLSPESTPDPEVARCVANVLSALSGVERLRVMTSDRDIPVVIYEFPGADGARQMAQFDLIGTPQGEYQYDGIRAKIDETGNPVTRDVSRQIQIQCHATAVLIIR